MKKKFTINHLVTAISASLALTVSAGAMSEEFDYKSFAKSGVPSFVRGELGAFSKQDAVKSLVDFISAQQKFAYSPKDSFTVSAQHTDALGYTHTSYSQSINGLKVFGDNLVAHSKPGQSGEKMYMLNGIKAQANPSDIYYITNNDGGEAARAAAQAEGTVVSEPELGYEYMADTGETALVYRTEVKYDMMHDVLFYSASSNTLLKRVPLNHSAIRKTYDLNNGEASGSNLTNILICTDDESCGNDEQAIQAHNGAKEVDKYFTDVHGRNSFDGEGTVLRSGVHLNNNLNNAFFMWDSKYMAYGDGDGSDFNAFTNAFDVIAHEFTHGFTSSTSKLEYQDESGAINESWSDVFGKIIDTYHAGKTVPDNWHIGVGLKKNGDPFRYMYNVTNDGQSKDYYPERYTGSGDYGGVHTNSGIGNLAFVLTVQGGTHPRNKTTIDVGDGIGMEKARNIWYRANNQKYLTQYSKFTDARSATMKAAQDLYGDAEEGAVCRAWSAVGVDEDDVSNCPGGTTTPTPNPTPTDTELENGVAKTNLTAKKGDTDLEFTFVVPANASNVNIAMSGGNGDADLFVKFGAKPTASDYDCRPYKNGNDESCDLTNTDGTYYVVINAYQDFSGVSLEGNFTAGTPAPTPADTELKNGVAKADLTAKNGDADLEFTFVVPANATNVNIAMSGGSGDADLFVKFGAKPTTNDYDCRPYKDGNNESCALTNTGGTYYIVINAYQDFSGVSLEGNFTTGSAATAVITGVD